MHSCVVGQVAKLVEKNEEGRKVKDSSVDFQKQTPAHLLLYIFNFLPSLSVLNQAATYNEVK